MASSTTAHTVATGTLRLPGHGLPVSHVCEEKILEGYAALRMTAREIAMLGMMNEITEKPEWHRKVFDEDISTKWTEEAKVAGFSQSMIDWCLAELCDKAEAFHENQMVAVFDSELSVVKTDSLISEELREILKNQCEQLRETMQDDWHPGSNSQVLNLVHPSLYPLVYGESRVVEQHIDLQNCLAFCTKGNTTEKQEQPEQQPHAYRWHNRSTTWKFSYRYQWLPCEVSLDEPTGAPHITSYVNNLHPERSLPLYKTLEKLISKAIPLWNKCLTSAYSENKRIECNCAEYENEDQNPENTMPGKTKEELKQKIKDMSQPEGVQYWCEDNEEICNEVEEVGGDIDAWLANEDFNSWTALEHIWNRRRQLILPEPGPYKNRNPFSNIDLVKTFQAQGLQVIVKIASIELTPTNASYAGGKWHLEGMANEHIVATALYYYDCENVTTSRLRFRQQAEMDSVNMNYAQDDHQGLETIYGLEPGGLRNDAAVQELGSVITKQGRMLAFPNVLQHLVEPFQLEDATRPGWRRFVALWLVDPHNRVLSTANVPPQQYDWWLDALEESTNMHERLPPELAKMVRDEGERLMITPEKAREYRLELMAERTQYVQGVDSEWSGHTYNFCEH